jgi:symplekin
MSDHHNRDPHNPFFPRMQQHVEKMMRTRNEIFDEASRKRTLEVLEAKRQRIAQPVQAMPQLQITPLGPGSHTLADVFTLVVDNSLKNFNVVAVPADVVAKINVNALARLDSALLFKAVEVREQSCIKI